VVAVPVFIAWMAGYLILDEAVVSPERSAERPPFDWVGAVLSALGVTILVLTMNNPLALPWLSPAVLIGAVAGALTLLAFFRWEVHCEAPMLQPELFRNARLTRAIVTRLLGFMAFTSIRIVFPVFLISVRGFGEGLAGFILFMTAIGLGVASQSVGRLADRLGERRFVVAGLGLFLLTLGGLVTLDTSTPVWVIAVLLFLNGAAQGVWSVPNNSMIMGSVPSAELGVAGALTNLTRNLGNVMGQAVATAVIVGVMTSRGFDIALSEINETPGAAEAFLDGWRVAYLFVVAFVIAALAVALRGDRAAPSSQSELGSSALDSVSDPTALDPRTVPRQPQAG
jgi:Na+/melibiose symporter-like transporter